MLSKRLIILLAGVWNNLCFCYILSCSSYVMPISLSHNSQRNIRRPQMHGGATISKHSQNLQNFGARLGSTIVKLNGVWIQDAAHLNHMLLDPQDPVWTQHESMSNRHFVPLCWDIPEIISGQLTHQVAAQLFHDSILSDFHLERVQLSQHAMRFLWSAIPVFRIFYRYSLLISLSMAQLNLVPLFVTDGYLLLEDIVSPRIGRQHATRVAFVTSWVALAVLSCLLIERYYT